MTAARLRIDADQCQGHGRCYSMHPDLFDSDDIGNGQVSRANLGPQDMAEAENAVESCPERAVLMERLETAQLADATDQV